MEKKPLGVSNNDQLSGLNHDQPFTEVASGQLSQQCEVAQKGWFILKQSVSFFNIIKL